MRTYHRCEVKLIEAPMTTYPQLQTNSANPLSRIKERL